MYVANHSMVVLNTISLFLLQGGEPEAGSPPPEQLVAQDFEVTSPTTAPCYGVLGCFPITAPWSTESRPFPFYPERPEKVNPLFCLRTRHNRDKCQYLRAGDEHSVYRSHFRAGSPVFLIVHGYLESQRRAWMQKATAELLIYKPDANVILVDWNGGSSPPYAQAVANIRVVGAVTAHLLKTLITTLGVDPRSIHIIGHSLGAHAAAYVGSNLQTFGYKIGRITGLDAAEPRFTGTDALVRLDPTDAEFVDAIHTDAAPFMAGGLGIREPVGHVDFYPNGGRDQPGCAEGMSNFISEKGSVLRGLEKFLNCNHVRSNDYFVESINSNCPFLGVQCHGWEEFTSGSCFSCQAVHHNHHHHHSRKGDHSLGPRCARMGMHALESVDKDHLLSGKHMKVFLMTTARAPFCRSQYRVTLTVSNSSKSVTHGGEVGVISFVIKGGNGTTNTIQLNSRERYFEPGSVHRQIVVGSCVGNMTAAILNWEYRTSVLNPLTWRLLMLPRIHLASVTIDALETSDSMTLTPPEGMALVSRKPMECMRNTAHGPGECQLKLISTLLPSS